MSNQNEQDKKTEKTQIRNKRDGITTDSIDIKNIGNIINNSRSIYLTT